MDQDANITHILVIPKNDKRLHYRLNMQDETHAMKIDRALEFFYSFVPLRLRKKIYDLVWTFKTFLIDIEAETVTELKVDLERLRVDFKDEVNSNEEIQKDAIRQAQEQKKEKRDKHYQNRNLHKKHSRNLYEP